jgi:hypothetical protein
MWFLLACSPAPELTGSCQLSPDNVLRATCSFEVDPPSPLSVTLTPEGSGEELVRTSPSEQASHELPLWRMRPDTRYTWVATAGEAELQGELQTGVLPPELELVLEKTGEPPSSDTLFVVDCAQPTAVTLSPEGEVVWYQDLAVGLAEGDHESVTLTYTEDDTLLTVVDGTSLREFSLDGRLLLDLSYGDAATQVLHHDVFRRNGRTFALTARLQDVSGVTYIVDGAAGFESDGTLLYDWDLSQLLEPSGPNAIGAVYWQRRWPDALDWAHANGLYVDEDGDLLLSLHSFSTVLRIEGDPLNPAFGTPVWALASEPTAPFGQDLALTDPDDLTDDELYGHQHHPQLLPDGTLQLFDNGEDVTDEARVLQLGLDLQSGEAPVRGSYPIGVVCPIEGSGFFRPDGELVAACTWRGAFYELDPTSGEVLGSTRVSCPGTTGFTWVPRAIPVDF